MRASSILSFNVAFIVAGVLSAGPGARPGVAAYVVVDTGQSVCTDTVTVISCPSAGAPFHGQDAQFAGLSPSFVDDRDGTVTDRRTGLMWQKGLLENISWDDAVAEAATFHLAGYHDWRLPTIKELYSLIRFDGYFGTDSTSSVPFIDRDYLTFHYLGGARFFDVQEWSATSYVGTTMHGDATAFGVNFADGRIKGYPKTQPGGAKTLKYARYVRGPAYGDNSFRDNGDGTVSDAATGLLWSRSDSGTAMKWEDALAWVDAQNAAGTLGYRDWRLPNAKELQSIVDYSQAPDAVDPAQRGPAIDPLFQITSIGGDEYPYFWTGTTLPDGPPDAKWTKAIYLSFGRALGWMEEPVGSGHWVLLDVHGAGAERCDPKTGDPEDYPHGFGPQGDVARIFNYVRLVRGGTSTSGIGRPVGTRSGLDLRIRPNPGFGTAGLSFSLPSAGPIRLEILDPSGRRMRDLSGFRPAGAGFVLWDGADSRGSKMAAGSYFARLESSDGVKTAKILLFAR